MYELSPKETLLPRAVAYLKSQEDVKGKCLYYCRLALALIGVSLPTADLLISKYGHSTAINAYHVISADPSAYGLVRVTQPSVHPIILCYYDNCGRDENGLECGHVALWEQATDILRSSKDYPNSGYFKSRLVGMFVPAPKTS